ncbi:ribonuclease Y [Apilactobacillus timberlakei]|uniref:Ribonuclease Y n=1 Tax=Apilactobacillus timberlakei TaxID=2008380 RepID=A0ABY2YS70_9LACO|nr:ribonuclease Y [Apilactobacillus timberlakei]TPR12686.1 ribonuclease Y [Apilactobacillus timberlakei]TPR13515.1 ribonuclease Y [Apilactobacillus timberlakei]TPR15588.1 ribonuclease Y [Apilactobacillus timberlakei]TPR18537.1 ribonuclease Y [Apilactobacillus timberlakei]TPR20384.1 ribonuclease Y [Apilactobacillus timberlakei]
MNYILIDIILVIIAVVLGAFVGMFLHKNIVEKKLAIAHKSAKDILDNAKRQAKTSSKEKILEAKEKSNQYRSNIEKEIKQRRLEVQRQENRLIQREDALDRKDDAFDKREDSLNRRDEKLNVNQKKLEQKQQEADRLVEQRQTELEKISALSQDEAKDLIIKETSDQLADERAKMVKDSYNEAQKESSNNAKNLVIEAIQQSAADIVSETTVSVVTLPSDDMKGRIIGREGRNIRTFETLTGIDLVIDDTPEAVVLSGFDPIRREVAKMALEKLIKDGRIHPARIEEMVDKSRRELDEKIQEIGEETVFDLGIHSMNPEMIGMIGKLQFKIYYGRNVLSHSIEVAKLSGVLASELGEDVVLAKRAGLLHEIGRSVNNETEGSHIDIGIDLAKKYHESPAIIDSIASDDESRKPKYIISELVSIANKIAISRPGAKSKSLESFVHRLESLEKIGDSFDQVKKSYAIQAGREIRIIVKPDKLSDTQAIVLARDIKNKIESDMEYPGHIKVTIIREVRSIEYAK